MSTVRTPGGLVLTPAEWSAVKRFQREVWDRSEQVDSAEEQLWTSLAYGFFLACGLGVTRACYLGFRYLDLMKALEAEETD